MHTIREFVRRLTEIVESKGTAQIGARHRRIVVPAPAMFALEGTILRTIPIMPIVPIERPGSHTEVSQLLEWMDISIDEQSGEGLDVRENDLGVDLAAILGLAIGRKVAFANEFPLKMAEADWTYFLPVGPVFDGGLYGPVQGDVRTRVITIVKALVTLPERLALSVGGAIRMRNAACCLAESDHSSAYGLLIAALETLSRAFGNPPNSWQDWDQAKDWDVFITELTLSEEDAEKLRKRLLGDKQLRLKRTFVEYAVSSVAPSFWEETYFQYEPALDIDMSGVKVREGSWNPRPITDLVPSDLGELRKRLQKSYDARSEVFHQSSRLEQIFVMPFPNDLKAPLSFTGLRLIIDHLLWREIETGAKDAPDLPNFEVRHPANPM